MAGKSLIIHLENVRSRIADAASRAGRSPADITLVAVTKTHPAEAVVAAMAVGLHDFGENYVQEALGKKRAIQAIPPIAIDEPGVLPPAPRWHFIGHLQSNKVKAVVGEFEYLHTVDSERLALAIDERARALDIRQKVLVQVKIGAEPSKSGIPPSELIALLKKLMPLRHLSVQGLMSIPEPSEDRSVVRRNFRKLGELRSQVLTEFATRDVALHPLSELSMGMSADFEIAIEEGATMIRLGTILFGARAAAQTPEIG